MAEALPKLSVQRMLLGARAPAMLLGARRWLQPPGQSLSLTRAVLLDEKALLNCAAHGIQLNLQPHESSQACIAFGETGSGKSTQVPQMPLVSRRSSARCATSPPSRSRGRLTGYQVRLESKRYDTTRLLFCTTGIALRMMLCEPPLEGCCRCCC